MGINKKYITHLLRRVEQSDEKAFEELFHHYFPWLITKVIGIVAKKEVAEEIVEDVFIKLWRKRAALSEIENIETYMYVAAKNMSYNYLKSPGGRKFHELTEQIELLKTNRSPEKIYLDEELKRQLDYAVTSLPEKCRHIFELVRIQGNSYKKTADILNLTTKTVENQLAIAVRKISERLGEYYRGLPDSKKSRSKKFLFLSLWL